MPAASIKPLESMWQQRGQITTKWAKDTTGLIEYRFNQQGFRGDRDYTEPPEFAFFGCSVTFGIGVVSQQTFAGRFASGHNYGISGVYDNQDIAQIITQFCNTNLYHPRVRMAVVWSDRDRDHLPGIIEKLPDVPIYHFFCGTRLPGNRRYKFPPALDLDASGTHAGPRTHYFMYKCLKTLFEQ